LQLLLAAKSALFIVLRDSLTGPEVEPIPNSFFVFSHGSGQQEEDLKRDVLVGFYHFLGDLSRQQLEGAADFSALSAAAFIISCHG
jgi:hypothetical protein